MVLFSCPAVLPVVSVQFSMLTYGLAVRYRLLVLEVAVVEYPMPLPPCRCSFSIALAED